MACHSKGQVAPFALTTYRQASGWAGAIAEAVEDRRMPPWHADPAYGTFANDAHLTEREIRTLVDWAAGGCPEGEPVEPLRPAGRPGGLVDPRARPRRRRCPRPFAVPAEGIVEYQEFEVDPGFREDRWVQAAEIRPGNRAVVHHCTVFLKPPGRERAGVHPGALGSYCLAATAPGTPPMILPPGMAKRIPAGWRLVFVVHYTPIGTAQTGPDPPRADLRPGPAVRKEVATQLLYDPDLASRRTRPITGSSRAGRRPPTCSCWRCSPTCTCAASRSATRPPIPTGRARPCSTSRATTSTGSTATCWRSRSGSPPARPLRCIAHYDNSADNPANPDPGATVRTGKQSRDEMFNGYFDVALADEDLSRPASPLAYLPIPPPPREALGLAPDPLRLRARPASRPSRPRVGQTDTPSLNRKSDLCRISRPAGSGSAEDCR